MAPSARIAAAIAGDKAQREWAYSALTALTHGDNADVTATLASATVRVSGTLAGAELHAEGRMTEAFARFGTVLAVTLRREGSSSWALLTFGGAEEAQSALAGAAESLGASGLAVHAVDTQGALGEAGAMGEAMRDHRKRVSVGVAVACVRPLVETVFGAAVSVVDASEFQRASSVLGELLMLDLVPLVTEFHRHELYALTWKSEGNAYNAVFQKNPSELALEDLLNVAWNNAFPPLMFSISFDVPLGEAGIGAFQWMEAWTSLDRLKCESTSEAILQRLGPMLLDFVKDPPQGTSDILLTGAWTAINAVLAGKAELAVPLIDEGLFQAAVATLKRTPSIEWVSHKTPNGILCGNVFVICWTVSTLELPMNKTQLLLDTGFVNACISMIKAFELQGRSKVAEASVCGVFAPLHLLGTLDLTAPEAAPIVMMLEDMPSTLRFVLDNSVSHLKEMGYTTGQAASTLCALVFGKQEGGDNFEFTQEMIDSVLMSIDGVFTGVFAMLTPVLPTFFLSRLVHLCISDVNKKLLLCNTELIKFLMEALLLDSEHTRQDQSEDVRGSIQRDAAECFMQLALFDPGRDNLQKDESVLDALRTLVDHGMTDEAKQYAKGALMALLPPEEPHPVRPDQAQGHVMVSYQWDVQDVIARIVVELQSRGYDVWWDRERMKGSVMDAMSEAVEGAEVLLYGCSSLYKESPNCRLEASYAIQQQKDMIPLMMENGFKAKGWLGLILGTRMWYAFHEDAVATDETFKQQMDALTREIGHRGKEATFEGIPPSLAPAPAPATAPAPAPAPAPVPVPATPGHRPLAAATTPSQDLAFTPSNQMNTPELLQHHQQQQYQQQEHRLAGGGQSLVELSAFMEKHQSMMNDREAQLRADLETRLQRQEREAEVQRQEAESQRREVENLRKELEVKRVEHQQVLERLEARMKTHTVASLQSRLQALHASKLLSDEEFCKLEDLIVDSFEEGSGDTGESRTQQVSSLVTLSERMTSDEAFIRQLRRKHL